MHNSPPCATSPFFPVASGTGTGTGTGTRSSSLANAGALPSNSRYRIPPTTQHPLLRELVVEDGHRLESANWELLEGRGANFAKKILIPLFFAPNIIR